MSDHDPVVVTVFLEEWAEGLSDSNDVKQPAVIKKITVSAKLKPPEPACGDGTGGDC